MSSDGAISLEINVDSSLTLRNIADWLQKFLLASEDQGQNVVHIGDQVDVDICGIQLIQSARRSAQAKGKVFSLAAPASGKLLETIHRSGLLEGASIEDRAFWLHEGAR